MTFLSKNKSQGRSRRTHPGVLHGLGSSGCPEGTIDNSPAFQRRVVVDNGTSPGGTAEKGYYGRAHFSSQSSLRDVVRQHAGPGVETPGYSRTSLRDKEGCKKLKCTHLQNGYTLVEILTATGLMLIMIIGLMSAFNQTQRAFRGGMRYTDVTEGSRSTFEMIVREVQQMSDTLSPRVINMHVRLQSDVTPVHYTLPIDVYPPDPLATERYAHWIQNFYFLTSDGRDLKAMGYRVLNLDPAQVNATGNILVGTLYRFWMDTAEIANDDHFDSFSDGPLSTLVAEGKLRRIMDGVVHFKVTPFDAQGRLYTNSIWGYTNNFFVPPIPPLIGVTNENVYKTFPPEINNMAPYRASFTSQLADGGGIVTSLPAYVELEIGTLEPQIVEQIKPIVASGNMVAVNHFITNHTGQIHIFRQQIPIRPRF